jgi:hypothetical protein
MRLLNASQANALLDTTGQWYRSVAPPVEASQLEESLTWTSSGGSELTGAAGDWVLTGPDGETWTVADEVFTSTYEPVEEGLFKKVGRARIAVLEEATTVESLEGASSGVAGDLLCGGGAGDVWVMPAAKMARYEPAS